MTDSRFILPSWNTPNRSHHMRAKGNLTFLEFIRVLEHLWSEVHPDIPFYAMGGDSYAHYPCIVYSLQMRKTLQSEPKMRFREQITGSGSKSYLIMGQRFQNLINFAATTESDPRMAEEVIEVFEDFVLEYVPLFKELGVSEMVYARRMPDDEQNRPGQGVAMRTVCFLVTLEKVIQTEVGKLDSVLARVRTMLESGELLTSATPSYGTFTASIDDQTDSAG